MTSTPRSRILLDSRIRMSVVLDDLAAAGYSDLEVVDRRDVNGYRHLPASYVINGVSPSGMRLRLESLEDVGAALDLPVGPPVAVEELPSTTDRTGSPVSIGSTVSLDDEEWTGTVRKIAKSGAVSITGWRGWLRPERITVRDAS